MKKVFILLLSIVFLLAFFIGCKKDSKSEFQKDKEEIVFGLVNNDSLCFMMGKTDAKGNLVLFTVDELYMPSEWARVLEKDARAVDLPTVMVGEALYAKFIYVADRLYIGEAEGDRIIYSSDGMIFSAAIGINLTLAKEYYASAREFMDKKDTAFLAFGGEYDGSIKIGISITETAGKVRMGEGKVGAGLSFFKRESGYHTDINGQTLYQNYDKMEEYLRTHGLNVDVSLIPEQMGKSWHVGDIDTGVTLNDFKNYMKIAKQLYDKIKIPEKE